ncbi:MAG: hypothetical protein VX874_20935 [Pseudomonadota bacterium]|nr:hypothetical protein [Pseudomonadota bacterium]
MQSTKGKGYKKRFSSWYDKNLVISKGEKRLSEIDGIAIQLLRGHQLIWQSWSIFKPYFNPLGPSFPHHSARSIEFARPSDLHRFFLSIAWRAAVSKLPDMREAVVEDEYLELLRQAILDTSDLSPEFFPIGLNQISTKGTVHNQTPYTDRMPNPPFAPDLYDESATMLRVYFDGLVAHIHLNPKAEYARDNLAFIGGSKNMVVSAVTYEASFQYENLLFVAAETHGPIIHNWKP